MQGYNFTEQVRRTLRAAREEAAALLRFMPQGAAKGDHVAPTQPFSQLSFKPEPLREKDMWGTTPLDQLYCRIRFQGYRYDGIFTPPSEQGSLVYHGY